eukprot:CAMPEP_0167750062 /NCGR_PEP_ID=MMETSP0110_2-20121227/5774_1 /TAXON_ID=629695 /ORGANISM="Gymnochlora sp., Strain CCMP2014" /LENGTH=330 /DNA_ID=CAMNT_0007635325 /DNA_START=91 /DNA_END=1083 /DNA_ORIENTATION=+
MVDGAVASLPVDVLTPEIMALPHPLAATPQSVDLTPAAISDEGPEELEKKLQAFFQSSLKTVHTRLGGDRKSHQLLFPHSNSSSSNGSRSLNAGKAGSAANGNVAPKPKRRKGSDLAEHEKWYCPFRCGKFYRKTSTRSIRRHRAECAFQVPPADNGLLELHADRSILSEQVLKQLKKEYNLAKSMAAVHSSSSGGVGQANNKNEKTIIRRHKGEILQVNGHTIKTHISLHTLQESTPAKSRSSQSPPPSSFGSSLPSLERTSSDPSSSTSGRPRARPSSSQQKGSEHVNRKRKFTSPKSAPCRSPVQHFEKVYSYASSAFQRLDIHTIT